MSGTSKGGNTDLASVFGGGSSAAPSGPAMPDDDGDDYAPEEGPDADAPPPEFSTHAEEALDPEAAPEDRIKALYRAIQACH